MSLTLEGSASCQLQPIFPRVIASFQKAELCATCDTHLTCLQSIQEHVTSIEDDVFADDYVSHLHGLIEEWNMLGNNIHTSQMVQSLKQGVSDLHKKISDLTVSDTLGCESVSSFDDVKNIIQKLQAALSSLLDIKTSELLELNLRIHRYVTHNGNHSAALKEELTKLYRLRDDAYEHNFELLRKFNGISNKWEAYCQKRDGLYAKLKDSAIHSTDHATHNSSPEVELQRELSELRCEEQSLEDVLGDCNLLGVIRTEMQEVESRISAQLSGAPSALESAPRPSGSQEGSEQDVSHTPSKERKTSSRIWRVIRMAFPIQVSLLVLCCLAIVLEPRCCALLNNMNFSFIPQLRYYRGPPPV